MLKLLFCAAPGHTTKDRLNILASDPKASLSLCVCCTLVGCLASSDVRQRISLQ